MFKGVTTPALTFVADSEAKGETTILELSGASYTGALGLGESWFLSPQKELLDRLKPNSFSVRPFLADCGIRTTAAKKQVCALADARAKDLPALEGKRIGRYWCEPAQIAVRFDRGQVLRSSDEKYDGAEFLVRQTAAYPIVGPHRHTRYFRNSVHALMRPEGPMDVRYLVGLLNSSVLRFAYVALTREAGQRAFPQVKLGALEKLPLRQLDFSKRADRKVHDEIVELVQVLLDLQDKLAASSMGAAASGIRVRIETLDRRLDDAVYKLYGLADSDRGVIENTLKRVPPPPNFPSDTGEAVKPHPVRKAKRTKKVPTEASALAARRRSATTRQ